MDGGVVSRPILNGLSATTSACLDNPARQPQEEQDPDPVLFISSLSDPSKRVPTW